MEDNFSVEGDGSYGGGFRACHQVLLNCHWPRTSWVLTEPASHCFVTVPMQSNPQLLPSARIPAISAAPQILRWQLSGGLVL